MNLTDLILRVVSEFRYSVIFAENGTRWYYAVEMQPLIFFKLDPSVYNIPEEEVMVVCEANYYISKNSHPIESAI